MALNYLDLIKEVEKYVGIAVPDKPPPNSHYPASRETTNGQTSTD